MKKKIQLKSSNIFVYLIIYFVAMTICNYFRTDYLISSLVDENVQIILISGHLSSVISSFFVILTIIAIISVCYFTKEVFFKKISFNDISDGIKTVIQLLIAAEVIRLLLAFILLRKELVAFDSSEDIINQLHNTDWYYYNSGFLLLTVIFGGIVFGVKFYDSNKQLIPALVFCGVFISGFYFLNNQVFNLI